MKNAILILDNNIVLRGTGFGALGVYHGELVFNTAMTGYMEALTDPSYGGQILTFTYPLIGNYGATFKWAESKKIHPVGVVVSELSDNPIHRDSEGSLEKALEKQKVGGISGVDTRYLVKIIRDRGTIPAVLSVYNSDKVGLVKQVAVNKPQVINSKGNKTIVLIDYGLKGSIVEELTFRGAKVIVVPATTTAKDILMLSPDGIVLSNGPGDPKIFDYAIKMIKDFLVKNMPIFGICLGHQLLALAAGGDTYKLKFGHRGINQPVQFVKTKKSFLTSQNHGYAVNPNSLSTEWMVSFVNLNDQTVEGLVHKHKPYFSVQFHPEGNPGPHDTAFLFDQFMEII
mgnify:FL=1